MLIFCFVTPRTVKIGQGFLCRSDFSRFTSPFLSIPIILFALIRWQSIRHSANFVYLMRDGFRFSVNFFLGSLRIFIIIKTSIANTKSNEIMTFLAFIFKMRIMIRQFLLSYFLSSPGQSQFHSVSRSITVTTVVLSLHWAKTILVF